MYALLTDSVLCKIRCRDSEIIQKMDLSRFHIFKDLLPHRTKIRILTYNENTFKYKWLTLMNVQVSESEAAYSVTTSLRGLSFEAPSGTALTRFVSLPVGFFENRVLTKKELFLSTLLLPRAEHASVSIKHKEHTPYRRSSIDGIIRSGEDTYDIKCIIDKSRLNVEDFCFNEREFLESYADTFYWNYTYRLLRSGYLIPHFFSQVEDYGDESICVPFPDLYWMFQLKYGRANDVYFSTSTPGYDHVSVLRNIKNIKVHKRYKRRDLVELKFESTHVLPVLIQNNMAIRHVRKR